MGHGCHDCGSPNSCECPGTHGDWYNQRKQGKTTLSYDEWDKLSMGHYNCRKCEQLHCVCTKAPKMKPDVYTLESDKPKKLTEIELIGVLIDNLPDLGKAAGQRVLDYAQRLFVDRHGSTKVMR